MPDLIRVTDHAVLRYLERAKGFDIEGVREHIAKLCGPVQSAGASCLRAEGVRFEFSSTAVVTVAPDKAAPNRTRQAHEAAKIRRTTGATT